MRPTFIFIFAFLIFIVLLCLFPIKDSFNGKITKCNGIYSLSPVYNPFTSPCYPWKYKTEFKVKPDKEPQYTGNGYYAKYSGVLPDLGPYSFYDVKTLPLNDALNLGIMRNNYGIIAYQSTTGLARFYPYANFSNNMAVKLINNNGWDTYIRT